MIFISSPFCVSEIYSEFSFEKYDAVQWKEFHVWQSFFVERDLPVTCISSLFEIL